MADLDKALEFTLEEEGGWSNHPEDPGGATKFGITIAVLKGMGKDYDLDGDGDVDEVDLSHITKTDARHIYDVRYWRGAGILSQRIATKHFDIGVNMGIMVGTLLLQKSLISIGAHGVIADGIFGAMTEAAVNQSDPASLLLDLAAEQSHRYYQIVGWQAQKGAADLGWTSEEAAYVLAHANARDLQGLIGFKARLEASKRRVGKLAFLKGWQTRAAKLPLEA
jgi:lysozyme family protein